MAYFIPQPTFPVAVYYGENPFINGFELVTVDGTTFTVGAGSARDLLSNAILTFNPFVSLSAPVITVDISTVGINGCYPNSIASLGLTSNTVFGVYLVANTRGIGVNSDRTPRIVVATGNDFLPPGMNAFRRIGLIYIASSNSQILPWSQSGIENERTYTLGSPVNAVSGGNATTLTPIDLSINNGVVPPGNPRPIMLTYSVTNSADNQSVTFSPDGIGPILVAFTGNTGTWQGATNMICGNNALGNASLDYRVANSAQSVDWGIRQFTDDMGNSIF